MQVRVNNFVPGMDIVKISKALGNKASSMSQKEKILNIIDGDEEDIGKLRKVGFEVEVIMEIQLLNVPLPLDSGSLFAIVHITKKNTEDVKIINATKGIIGIIGGTQADVNAMTSIEYEVKEL